MCGDYGEFQKFLRDLPMNMNANVHYEYVRNVDSLRGVQNPHGYFYGTWKDRSDIVDIMVMLKVATKDPNPQLDSVVSRWRQKQRYS